jgi:hypothetical protein
MVCLAGCTTQSTRPEIATPLPSAGIDESLLVGQWTCQDLNPLPGQPVQTISARYADDGRFQSASELPARRGIGPLRLGQQGRWRVQDGRLITSEVRTTARTADGNTETDAMAQAGAELVDLMAGTKPQASEILTLDREQLVLRPVEVVDPPVIGCVRRA